MEANKTTNRLLFIIALPLAIYSMQMLGFILVPLISSMFIALLFVPMLRRLNKKGWPKWLGVTAATSLMILIGFIIFLLMDLSSKEIMETKDEFLGKAETKIDETLALIDEYTSSNTADSTDDLEKEVTMRVVEPTLNLLAGLVPQLLMTLFFVVLWFSESINFEKLLNNFLIKNRRSSIRVFRRIEKDIVLFLRVKFLISLGTGVCTGLLCYAFGVSFPIFWGFFAFAINFVQMIGSIIAVVCCSIFAYVEMDTSSMLLIFALSITGVQVLFGSILEPIYMGRSFSINVITVLVMLMFWGFVWGVPGMIMSIPITVFLKIVFEQFEKTEKIAKLMS